MPLNMFRQLFCLSSKRLSNSGIVHEKFCSDPIYTVSVVAGKIITADVVIRWSLPIYFGAAWFYHKTIYQVK